MADVTITSGYILLLLITRMAVSRAHTSAKAVDPAKLLLLDR